MVTVAHRQGVKTRYTHKKLSMNGCIEIHQQVLLEGEKICSVTCINSSIWNVDHIICMRQGTRGKLPFDNSFLPVVRRKSRREGTDKVNGAVQRRIHRQVLEST